MWKWTNKKIAYVSILIAASVAFVIIGSRLAAITTFPSFKIAFGGLPIKITGYLFGPLIGAITGLVADILSFAILPTYYHPLYSLIMALAGFIPGVVMWLMVKKKRSTNTHFFTTIITLLVIGITTVLVIHFAIPDSAIYSNKKLLLKNKIIIEFVASSGFFIWAGVLIILKVVKKWRKYISLIAPIILFCAILEVGNSLLTPFADSLTLKVDFANMYILHMFTSPIKILSNVIIVSVAYKIVGPLVTRKMDNSY